MSKAHIQLAIDLKCIADIAHYSGICGINEFDALCAIRMLSRDYFDFRRTEEQMKSHALRAMECASPYFSRKG